MIEGLPGSSQPGADTKPTTFTPNHLPGSDSSFPIPVSSLAIKPKFHLWRSAGIVAVSLLLSYLILGSVGALAFLQPVTDFFTSATGINESVLKEIVEPISGKIKLNLLPTGHGNGLDADTVDNKHADFFATSAGLDESNKKLAELSANLAALDLSPYARSSQLSSNALTLNGREASFYLNVANLGAGTLQDARLSANVVLLDLVQTFNTRKIFADGLTVSGGTLSLPSGSITSANITDGALVNADISSTAAIAYSKISLSGAILGSDLATNIFISTTGNLTTTGGGTITSAGLLTASSGLTLSGGTLTLPAAAINDSALSTNVALLTGSQTFSGAKTFSSALTAPIATNTINGLVINSGALSGITTLNLTGAITGATATNTINGLVFSSGNATLANLTSSSGALTSTVVDSGSAVGFVLGTSTTYSTSGAKLLSLKNNTVEEFAIDKDGNLTVNGNLVATGTIQGTQLISTVLTGTAPLVVSSTTQVANLNASFIEGYNAATLMSQPQPNLVLNSDFSRRNKWMTFMPEVFTDTSGWTLVTGTGIGTVATNTLTAGSTGGWRVRAGLSTWRDARYSAQFKWVSDDVGAETGIEKFADTNNRVFARFRGTGVNGIAIHKLGGVGAGNNLCTAAHTATVNNWYWIELEAQGGTYIAKLYSSGASPVAKSSATLVATCSAATGDTTFAGYTAFFSEASVAMQLGGLATGDGGVYVEGWGPESTLVSFAGTKGGQAIGFDETADAGPVGKQWAVRTHIPAASRGLDIEWAIGASAMKVAPSTSYMASLYIKTENKGGTGDLINVAMPEYTSAAGFISGTAADRISDAGETAWTRKTVARTTDATARYSSYQIGINYNLLTGAAKSATGTAYVMLTQYEQGSVVTPWRNAPGDSLSSPMVVQVVKKTSNFNSSGVTVQTMDERDLAHNIFLPEDAVVTVEMSGVFDATAGTDPWSHQLNALVDGSASGPWPVADNNSGNPALIVYRHSFALAAGKHRIAMQWRANSGGAAAAMTLYGTGNDWAWLTLTATRGR